MIRATIEQAEERLTERLNKVEALANDERAPKDERKAAEAKAVKLRAQLNELRAEDAAAYQNLVEQGKTVAGHLWKLGDLACQIEKKYGSGCLEQYAEDIGVPYNTLKTARTTARAWPEKDGRLSFSAAQPLNALSDRYALAAGKPDMTSAEARAIAATRRVPRPPRRLKPPDRGDLGPDSTGEAERLRTRNDELERDKSRLEKRNLALENEIETAKAGIGLADDIRRFVDTLVERVEGMTDAQRAELLGALYRALDLSTPPPDDGFDVPAFLRRPS